MEGNAPWRVSLHGGHSGDYCDHAEGSLREILEAAVAAGYHTFGVSEHVPRVRPEDLYDKEIEMGWTVEKLASDFARYTHDLPALVKEFADRLTVLRGFEIEVVPPDDYVTRMRAHWEQRLPDGTRAFDYFVGSVHFVDGFQIDGPPENFLKGVAAFGSIEALAVRYYDTVAEMITALHPDVVGHLDLIKRNVCLAGFELTTIDTQAVHAAADRALEAARAHNGILDLNLAGWRKGLGEPYPAPWLLQRAHEMGVPFCFGDDSHRVSDVAAGLDAAREYLLQHGIPTVTVLTRDAGAIVRHVVPL